MLLAIALHVLLLAPMISGAGGPGSREHPAGAHASAKSAATVSTWIELTGSSAPNFAASFPNVHLQRLKVRSSDIESAEEEGARIVQDDPAPEYVRRMAALTARIQGLWKLPRSRLAADFHCRARLHPGESGSVEEVELESCDGSGPVRASIALAIEHAMPLPLPQDRSGSAADIVLQFTAYAGSNGASHTSIEPAAN
jgi:hypothetical protein